LIPRGVIMEKRRVSIKHIFRKNAFKKTAVFMLMLVFVLSSSIVAFAAPGDRDDLTGIPRIVTDKLYAKSNTASDSQFLVSITKPEQVTDSTYKKSYVFSGVTEHSDIRVLLAIYDEEIGSYKPMHNTDGEIWWDLGFYGAFAKEMELNKGTNNISVICYKTSKASKLTEEDIQVSNFTITRLNENIVNKIMNSAVDLAKGIFSPLR
jgi:hypothetical protein